MTEPDTVDLQAEARPHCAPRTKPSEREPSPPDEVAPAAQAAAAGGGRFLSALCIVVATILVPGLDRGRLGARAARRRGRVRRHPRAARGRPRRAGDDHRRVDGGDQRPGRLPGDHLERLRRHRRTRPAAARRRRARPARGAGRQRPREPRDHDGHASGRVGCLRRGVGDGDARRAIAPSWAAATSDGGGLVVRTDEGVGIQLGAVVERVKQNLIDRGLGAAELIPDRRQGHHPRHRRQPRDDPHQLRGREHARALAADHHARAVRPRHPHRPPAQRRRAGDRHRIRPRRRRAGRRLAIGDHPPSASPPERSACRPTPWTSSTSSWSAT